jgi:hypothetical protein
VIKRKKQNQEEANRKERSEEAGDQKSEIGDQLDHTLSAICYPHALLRSD